MGTGRYHNELNPEYEDREINFTDNTHCHDWIEATHNYKIEECEECGQIRVVEY